MTLEKAIEKANQLLNEQASRSKVCSFVNDLSSAELITEDRADSLADVLASDRGNNIPVLQGLLETLSKSKP